MKLTFPKSSNELRDEMADRIDEAIHEAYRQGASLADILDGLEEWKASVRIAQKRGNLEWWQPHTDSRAH